MYGIYKDESYIHRYTLSIFLMRGLEYKKILDLHIHNNNEKLFNCLHNYSYWIQESYSYYKLISTPEN